MEHHHAINGKINYKYTINGSSSIAAMLVYQRVFESSSSLMIFSWIPQDFFRGRFVSSENPHFRPAQRWGHSATRSSQRWGKGSRNRAQCRCCCCRKLLAMGQWNDHFFIISWCFMMFRILRKKSMKKAVFSETVYPCLSLGVVWAW